MSLVFGLILMLGSGAAIGVSKFGPGEELAAEPSATAPGPAPPETTAELLAYVTAGAPVDSTPYLLPGNSEPVYGFYSPGQSVDCLLDTSMYFLLCRFAEPAWPVAERPADCAETQGWSPESVLVSLDDGVGDGVRRGFCYNSADGWPLQQPSTVLEHGHSMSAGGFSCRSESWYLACAYQETGDGFVMGHDFYKLVGTVVP
jgi:hypothetical protein